MIALRILPRPQGLPFSRLTLSLLLLVLPGVATAFDVNGSKWPGATTNIHIGMPGNSPSGVPWSTALEQAARAWNDATVFEFQIVPQYRHPCTASNGLNGADFASTACGVTQLTKSTLAVTLTYFEYNPLGTDDIVQADIVFNQNHAFDIYDGPIDRQRYGAVDFRRVALHELGHVLGLGHEQSHGLMSAKPAIMAPMIGNLYTLQADDIEGANFLYAGTLNCDSRPAGFGVIHGALQSGDCRVKQLMSGGSDSSYVDVYHLELSTQTDLDLRMSSSSLDSVLVLADARLRILEIDDDGAGGCDALIRRTVPAGSYVVLANTYVHETWCGAVSGAYEMSIGHSDAALRRLSGQLSFRNTHANANFLGGVTTDGGRSFGNRVRSTEAFEVRGRIQVDPLHQGQPGFLVAAAVLESGEILVKHGSGDFLPYQPEIELIPAAQRKVLSASEELDVFAATAADMGIGSIVVDFLIGYGVDASPGELYYAAEPINLIVTP